MGFKKNQLVTMYAQGDQTSVSHEGEEVTVAKDGTIEVPSDLVKTFEAHGFSTVDPDAAEEVAPVVAKRTRNRK